MDNFLANTDLVDWHTHSIRKLADELSSDAAPHEIVARCFQWVRDEVVHTSDSRCSPVTCKASDVLKHRTGICYAKSHLLAALLRASNIPAAFGYQRLSIDDVGAPFCLHGFNYVFLESFGWHPVDARGNRKGISTTFDPPTVSLAFTPKLPGERTYDQIFAEPLPIVTAALQRAVSISGLEAQLPDWDA